MTDFKKHRDKLALAAYFVFYFFTLWTEDFASEYQALEHGIIGQCAPYVMNMLAAETLLFMLLHHRLALSIGLAAGFLWFPAGDVMAVPWWIATMALCVYLFDTVCNHKLQDDDAQEDAIAQVILWLLSMVCYNIAWSGTSHYWYLTGFILVFIVTHSLYVSFFHKAQHDEMEHYHEDANDTVYLPEEHPQEQHYTQDYHMQDEHDDYACEPAAPERPFEYEISRLESFHTLPQRIDDEVQGIIKYARLIQECMLTDPHDVEPGNRFLQRYLPATLEIVEKGAELTQKLKQHGDATEFKAHKIDILQALHSAFLQKYIQLLENDEAALKTEMSTLEKLLKTDGFL